MKYLGLLPHQAIGILGILLIIIGLVSTKILLSIGMLILTANALFNLNLGSNLKQLKNHLPSLLFILVFICYLLTGFYSDDIGYWAERIRIKLPFIAIPFAFAAIRPFSEDTFYKIIRFFFWVLMGSSVVVTLLYLSDFTEINTNYAKGRTILTPHQSHIRYSLLLTFAVACGITLLGKRVYTSLEERAALIFGTVYMVVFLHVLAVRSGLLALYLIILFWVIAKVIAGRHLIPGLFILIAMLCLTWASFNYIPTLKQKMEYVRYDYHEFKNGRFKKDNSDSERIISIVTGLEIANKNKLLGVGAGDICTEMDAVLEKDYPAMAGNRLLPHNQFVFTYLVGGVPALICLVLALFYPLFYKGIWRSFLFVAFNIIFLTSFLTEHTLEAQLGIASYLTILFMILKFYEGKYKG